LSLCSPRAVLQPEFLNFAARACRACHDGPQSFAPFEVKYDLFIRPGLKTSAWSLAYLIVAAKPYLYQRSSRAAKCRAWERVRETATNGLLCPGRLYGEIQIYPLPTEIRINGSLSSDPVVIVDVFARHFFPDEPLSNPSHFAIEAIAQVALHSSSAEAPPSFLGIRGGRSLDEL
jgi:hypothetical protein